MNISSDREERNPASQPVANLELCGTILLSAFLLFQVQPLMSRCILPWFGGCPAVWTTCMLFFQTLLFSATSTPICCSDG